MIKAKTFAGGALRVVSRAKANVSGLVAASVNTTDTHRTTTIPIFLSMGRLFGNALSFYCTAAGATRKCTVGADAVCRSENTTCFHDREVGPENCVG